MISAAANAQSTGFRSIETGHTICKVRSAVDREGSYVVASSYEGTLLGISYEGGIRWKNELSGFMNRDIWCEDITGDDQDEILAANADGTLFCLNSKGKLLWTFQANAAPLNTVSVVRHHDTPYVVCGGYDTNLYYLSAQGQLVRTVPSSAYSREKAWGKPGEKRFPETKRHIANYVRTLRGRDGANIVALHGTLNSNTTTGSIYLFEPLADKPFQIIDDLPGSKPYGDFSTIDVNEDGIDEVVLGTSTMIQDSHVVWIDVATGKQRVFDLADIRRKIDGNGYRVAQTVSCGVPGSRQFLIAFGSQLIVAPPDLTTANMEFFTCGYSFNDIWKDPVTGHLVLASVQSGGSCIHILDPGNAQWKDAFTHFVPRGTLKSILENTALARQQLRKLQLAKPRRPHRPVYMLTESLPDDVEQRALQLEKEYGNPVFLQGHFMPTAEDWDRSTVASEQYRKRRDRRRRYTLSQQQALRELLPLYEGDRAGAAFWGGHGNDPYMFSTDTIMKISDAAVANRKMSVFIYPELEHYDDDFALVLRDHFYPMAEHFQGKQQYIYVRTKHAFWQSVVYMPLWSRLLSGEFADVFIPSMEETTDKTMEQSVAGRVGIWASGAVNQWGSRCARDNASFDRLRQHSHQMIPNHFLRTQIYNIAYGATFQNNYPVNQQYFSLLYELIAKGVLFVPSTDEIVSFNPVHLSMTSPDPHYVDEGNNAKWLTFYDEQFEQQNPMVFSRLNGTWPGAPVTEWDFSRYAAGVRDRRLHFLPPYENGLVLITPPQHGVFADTHAPRGRLVDHLHPLYRSILREYFTDGRQYLSADGTRTYPADQYFKMVEADIRAGAKKLPLTVCGEVAWVCAQTSPTHLRLTIVDGGYIHPSDKTATIIWHTVHPSKVTDLLSGELLPPVTDSPMTLNVPCGLFRFLDIELNVGLE